MFNTIIEPSADENITSFVELPRIRKKNFDENLVCLPNQPIADQADEISINNSNSVVCVIYASDNKHTQSTRKKEFINHMDTSVDSIHDQQLKLETISSDEDVTQVDIVCTPSIEETEFNNSADLGPPDSHATSAGNDKGVKKLKTSKAPFNKKGKLKFKKSNKKNASVSTSVIRKPKYEYPRLCSGCGHAYKTKQSFWNHKQKCPLLPQNVRRVKVDENGVPVEGAASSDFINRREYICAHCERRYRKKYNLREHLKNTCRGKPCNKGRLQCWATGCLQAFYKYVDLVQHVTMKHGQDLQIQKLQFPNFNAFNTWKTEESNSKFMYARKITGSKRFSNTKYHYFVCQFNHRNEKKNNNRKTNRRKKDSLVVPNYNCPSRIMVKECENQILVTYISSHNHELNLSNVKYQPLEKEARGYIKTLLQLGVTPQKIIDHLRSGVGNTEIDSFLATKQHFLTLNQIKRMESKLKAKSRIQTHQEEVGVTPNGAIAGDSDSLVDDTFPLGENAEIVGEVDSFAALSSSFPVNTQTTETPPPRKVAACTKESDEMIRSIEGNLKKLKGYMRKSNIQEKQLIRISKIIQELCNECESTENINLAAHCQAPARKLRVPAARRKRKTGTGTAVKTAKATSNSKTATAISVVPQTVSIAVPTVAVATIAAAMPVQPIQMLQPIMIQNHQSLQTHQIHHQAAHQTVDLIGEDRTVNTVNSVMSNTTMVSYEKSFTPAINENTDLLKPIFQPFNISLLALKSIDRYISEREQLLLQQVDNNFSVGWIHDAIVNRFLNLVCGSSDNVLAVDTSITEYVPIHQKVPDVWRCFNWANIDTIFIPCNPSKKQWILMVVLVKQMEVQILDPTGSYEDAILNVYKKHESTIRCWYEMLRNFLGIAQWNVTSPQHNKHPDPVNSGILICWYVLQYINKRSLIDNIDVDHAFRQFIYNTIVSNSSAV